MSAAPPLAGSSSSKKTNDQQQQQPNSSSGLYRAPTWVRNIQFGQDVDVGLGSTEQQAVDASVPRPASNRSASPANSFKAAQPPPSSRMSNSPRASFVDASTSPAVGTTFLPSHTRQKSSLSSLGKTDALVSGTNQSTPKAGLASTNQFTSTPSSSRLPSSSPEWSRAHLPIPGSGGGYSYGGSSADAYAVHQPDESNLLPGSFFRPETAMSSWSQDDQAQRATSSFDTHNTGESSNPTAGGSSGTNAYKRGSVLSFQTALSGGLENQRSHDGLRDIARQQQQQATGNARRPGSAGWATAAPPPLNNRTYPPGPGAGNGSIDVDQLGQQTTRRFGGSQPSSAHQSPVMLQNKTLPPAATAGPSSPNLRKATNLPALEPTAEDEPSAPAPVTLDRNRTVRPTHGRHSSNNASLDLKTQPPIPVSASAVGAPPPPAKENAPPLPVKESPPLQQQTLGRPTITSPDLSDSIIPPPLPTSAANAVPTYPAVAPGGQSPVSDFRKKPLVDVTPAMQAAGRASLQQRPGNGITAGVGAHDVNKTVSAGPPSPDEPMRPRSGSTAGLFPRAMMVEAPTQPAPSAEPVGRTSFSSAETPSREPSPPPEGEVEARAEWERARMKQKQKRRPSAQDTSASRDAANVAALNAAARRTTLRGQLKPLQLVAADDDRMPIADLRNDTMGTSPTTPMSRQNGGAAMSTQQLQKQQARDQRRSVGQINLAMGMAGGEMSSGANGPYPMFPSPSTGAVAGGRQYAGMLPQRSLVPPFELQHRPDGLLSGLIGPDGVRRSVNDPEVCIECMMRDEDMIDVHVVGAGLWERESDREFDDALRVEQEDDARRERERSVGGASATGEEQSIGGHSSSHAASREGGSVPPRYSPANTKVRVKRVGKHDPLTADRLKLHTQMNPPASSHRWRTLQNFLAVQARYIAMEQRARQEEWERTHPAEAAANRAAAAQQATSKSRHTLNGDSDSRSVSPAQDTFAPIAARKSVSKNRSASAIVVKSNAKLVDDDDLAPSDRVARDRDVILAREARRKNAASATAMATSASNPNMAIASKHASKVLSPTLLSQSPILGDEERRRMTSTPISVASVAGAGGLSAARRPHAAGLSTPLRGVSASDLRSVSGAMLASPTVPSTPDSLAPPSLLAGGGSMLSTPRGFGGRTASQLSLAPSGSMLDMHVALAGTSNQADHRAGHGLALPSPIDLDRSANVSQQAFGGFPGDGDVSPADPAQAFRASFQEDGPRAAVPDAAVSKASSGVGQQSGAGTAGKKKKGLRGFFSKLSGSGDRSGNASYGSGNAPSQTGTPGDTFDDGDTSKRSEADSGQVSPRIRRQSMSTDSYLAPPPGIAGLLSRARRSTSSLLGGRESVEVPREMYNGPPGMMSPDRFDMGPFQPPLPPERKQSRPGVDDVGQQQQGFSAQQTPRQQSSSPTLRRPPPSRLSMQAQPSASSPVAQGGGSGPLRSAPLLGGGGGNANLAKPSVPFAPGTPSSMQTSFNSSSRLSQGRTQSSSNFTHSTTSAASSRTASMMSMQSKTNGGAANGPVPLTMGYGGGVGAPTTRLGGGAGSSKLPTIESSPGMSPRTLDGDQGLPRQSLNLNAAPPLRPVRSPRRPDGNGENVDDLRRQRSASALGMQTFPGGGGNGGDRSGGYSYPGLGGRGMGGPRREDSGAFSLSSTQEDMQANGPPSHEGNTSTKSGNRKSKLLKLPFGFAKSKSRSSMLSTTSRGDVDVSQDGGGPPGKSGSLRSRGSAHALRDYDGEDDSRRSKPRKSINLFDRDRERPRAFSSAAAMSFLPPRSQSALGNLPTQPQDGHPYTQHSPPTAMRKVSEEPW